MTAEFVIGYQKGTHVIYRQGELVYEGQTIIYVGKKYLGDVDEIWPQGLAVIAPGFIDLDADIDTDHALFDIATPEDSEKQFQMHLQPLSTSPFSKTDFINRHRFSIAQLIRNGITTALPIAGEMYYPWNHSYEECQIMKQVANEMGMRLYIGPSFKSRKTTALPIDLDQEQISVAEALRFCSENPRDDNALVNSFVNPCQIAITRLEVLKKMALFAQEKKMPFRLHACEAIREWHYTLPTYGQTTIELLYKNGMLYQQFIIPHCITATTNELKLLAETQTSVVSTPLADANFGTALFSFDKYLSYGINMTMGTDTQPVDMLRNLRMAWDLDRLCWRRKFFSTYSAENGGEIIPLLPNEPHYPKTGASDFFDAATINGAKALDRNDLGKLTVGAKADIIVINLNDINIGPYHDPIRTIINACNGNHVKHTIINGRTLMKDYLLVDIDEQKVMKDAQETFHRFANLYSIYDKQNRSLDELYPSSYPIF